ncbi:transposase family protein, partial [Salininema proteolyticum]
HHRHGVNEQVLSAPDGHPLWVSDALPGRVFDSTAATHHGLDEALRQVNTGVADEQRLHILVDLGYLKFESIDSVVAPFKKPKNADLAIERRVFNRVHGAARALEEKANADLKVMFKCLDKVGLDPEQIGTVMKACLVAFHRIRPRRKITERTG